jgi:hypothetical protein
MQQAESRELFFSLPSPVAGAGGGDCEVRMKIIAKAGTAIPQAIAPQVLASSSSRPGEPRLRLHQSLVWIVLQLFWIYTSGRKSA